MYRILRTKKSSAETLFYSYRESGLVQQVILKFPDNSTPHGNLQGSM